MDEGVIFYRNCGFASVGSRNECLVYQQSKSNLASSLLTFNLVIKSVDKTNIRSLTLATGFKSKLIESP